ncbi:MAG: hypothetical protein NTY02_17645 [Acidobacteria bacterium]|nr:hypothetical protein [Acidobacteriota bacterium]
MAIRRSAASDIRHLIDDLCGDDAVARDAAGARLSVIGVRAVPHLLAGFTRCPSVVGRAAIVKVLEASADRRGVELALAQLDAVTAEPQVQAAALSLLGSHLDGDESPRALEAISTIILDEHRPDLLRARALEVLSRALPDVLAPLRKRLANDRNPAVRRWARGEAPATEPALDPRTTFEAVLAGEDADPAVLRGLVAAGGADAPLTILHGLVEVTRAREDDSRADADRDEWRSVRGALHLVLAERDSRVALYDLREAIAASATALPPGFAQALELVGDAACLESIADALARTPAALESRDQQWRDALVKAGRAIVRREGLTRRHAVIRKIVRTKPAVADVLLAPAP